MHPESSSPVTHVDGDAAHGLINRSPIPTSRPSITLWKATVAYAVSVLLPMLVLGGLWLLVTNVTIPAETFEENHRATIWFIMGGPVLVVSVTAWIVITVLSLLREPERPRGIVVFAGGAIGYAIAFTIVSLCYIVSGALDVVGESGLVYYWAVAVPLGGIVSAIAMQWVWCGRPGRLLLVSIVLLFILMFPVAGAYEMKAALAPQPSAKELYYVP